jgi:hypothetical protein
LGPQIDAVSQYLFHAFFFLRKTLGQFGPGKLCSGQVQKRGGNTQDRSKSGEEILVYFSDKQRFKLAVLIDVDY